MDLAVPSTSDRIRTLNDHARRTFTGLRSWHSCIQELGDEEKASSSARFGNLTDLTPTTVRIMSTISARSTYTARSGFGSSTTTHRTCTWGATILPTATKPAGFSPSCMPANIEHAHNCHRRQAVYWKEICRLRREQIEAARKPQLTLFELKEDARPASQRSVEGRYTEPLLFKD